MFNSIQNVISEPTRGRALLDLILVADDCNVFDSGRIDNPPDISDHKGNLFDSSAEFFYCLFI